MAVIAREPFRIVDPCVPERYASLVMTAQARGVALFGGNIGFESLQSTDAFAAR